MKNSLIVIHICILFFFCSSLHALEITEIQYDPEGSDNGYEYVEVYGIENLTNATFGDLKSNDTLMLINYVPGNYSIILESDTLLTIPHCTVYATDATIGNGLGNTGDTLFLFTNTTIFNSSYPEITLSAGESLHKSNDTWVAGPESPCAPHILLPETKEEPVSEECTTTFSMQTEKQLYEHKETILFHHTLNPEPETYQITYWIEDADGVIVKSEKTTQNTHEKRYTPSIEEKEKILIIKSSLEESSCTSDTYFTETLVGITNPTYTSPVCEPEIIEADCPMYQDNSQEKGTIESISTRKTIPSNALNMSVKIKGTGEYVVSIISPHQQTEEPVQITKSSSTLISLLTPTPITHAYVLLEQNQTILDVHNIYIVQNDTISLYDNMPPLFLFESPSSPPIAQKNKSQTILPITTYAITPTTPKEKTIPVVKYLKWGAVVLFILTIVYQGYLYYDKHTRKNRSRLGTRENHIRNSGLSKRAHRQKSSKLHQGT